MSYKDNVKAAGAALKRGEEANWELARLTYENTNGQGQKDKVTLETWAADVAMESGRRFGSWTAGLYRRIWEQHGNIGERPSFSDAYWETRGANPQEERDDIRVREARAAMSDPVLRPQVIKQLEPHVQQAVHRSTAPEPEPPYQPKHEIPEQSELDRIHIESILIDDVMRGYSLYHMLKDRSFSPDTEQFIVNAAENAAFWYNAIAAQRRGERINVPAEREPDTSQMSPKLRSELAALGVL